MKKTLVLGASTNPERYSFKAVTELRKHGHQVIAIGIKPGRVADVDIIDNIPMFTDIDTVTLYLNPERQKAFYDYIVGLKPKRIIFNPGTENEDLIALAKKNSIEPVEACTLVLLSIGEY